MKLYDNKIFVGSDHAGFKLKAHIISHLKHLKCTVQDVGTSSEESVDYTDYVTLLVKAMLAEDEKPLGILICGSGIGMSIAANRYPQIRAALCHSEDYAKIARMHNDANVLALGARYISPSTALDIITTFFTSSFEGGRHTGRLEKLAMLPNCQNSLNSHHSNNS
ncbi:ribose 5-phosphate isomerase B [Rickettsiales endosymbiont of Peranema trichophorum]|uniref:ribose 5-phosphate isomerase B n=1 Tax=Rickettsiales endosymbiont of Peranema trichophorum TaxID=2486577 RepID=UPI001022DFA9|nr:ribose 5-phosphate isomerase B [Rickettsiales endosymbiont of Peranema trichophorum]RZI47229.1 ribose 5-phosphate isomerase B [Rickettsiales endosymbiont of Peranema trichophorum]